MQKPFKYTIICNKTNEVLHRTNRTPVSNDLMTWESTSDSNVFEKKQTRTAYIDVRYNAKLRLFNYLTFTKNRLSIPSYKPYEGTDIGETKAILS